MPLALLLLIVLSTFTLFSYRDAVARLGAERREQAVRAARRVAEALARGEPANVETLRLRAPEAWAVTLSDPQGTILLRTGLQTPGDPLAPLAGVAADRALGLGPGPELMDTVAGFAPLMDPDGQRRWVRVDLDARGLATQQRSLRVLSWVVLGLDGAVGVLVLLYLRHLLGPWEKLLARARAVGHEEGEEAEMGDETTFLVSTFERAVTALESARTAPEPDIAALERTLSASLESGLLLLGPEGRVLGLNPLGRKILDLPEPTTGDPLEEVLAQRPTLRSVLREAVQNQEGIRRLELSPEGDAERTLGLTVHPLRRDDGDVRGFLVLFTDLTESKRQAAESRLSESLEHLGELAAGVAHELRNGLATLTGYLTLLERNPGDESVGDYLNEMRRETRQLERVLGDFLTFARPGTSRLEAVPLAGLLHRVAADPALPGERLEIDDHAALDARVQGDPRLLEQAVKNLVLNAVQADPEGPVTLSLVRAEGGGGEDVGEVVEIRVEDSGPGIPPDLRDKIFQPFVSGRPDGVGLGLALAHRIVHLHGGALRLDDRPDGGTRATIRFSAGKIVTIGNSGVGESAASRNSSGSANP